MIGITESIAEAAATLAAQGIERPRCEARLLLAEVTGRSSAQLLASGPEALTAGELEALRALVARRAAREPMAYILGRAEFWSLGFAVQPGVLIPRADSETLIGAAVAALPERDRPVRLLDIGVGSGCLVLALLHHFGHAQGTGTDISATALVCTRANAVSLGLEARLTLVETFWVRGVEGPFDLVVSNPPYIPSGDIAGLQPEVARHEPRLALDGGSDGLDAYRAILADLPRVLAKDGVGLLEIGHHQRPAISALVQDSGFFVEAHHDLTGTARCLELRVR